MISDAIGRAGLSLKAAIAGFVGALGIAPNALTLSGLVPMTLAAWHLSHGRMTVAALWIVVGGVLDLIDGAVARASGKTSPFGGILDSVIDRASDTLVLLGAVIYFNSIGEPLYVGLGAAALGGALGVSYARARAENVIPECRVGFTERGERLVLFLLGLFLGRLAQALLLLTFLAWLTTIQRLLHAYRVTSARERQPPDTPLRQGLEVWGPLGRWLFLNWPRGTWQYDLVCALIIGLLLTLPGV